MEAGEILAVNIGTNAVMNVFATVIVFDDTSALSSRKIANLASGDQTLFTVGGGKSVYFVSQGFVALGGGTTAVNFFNSTANTRAYVVNVVPSGGSVALTNKVSTTVSASTLTAAVSVSLPGMAAGDFLNINSDGGVAGQFAWVNVVEK